MSQCKQWKNKLLSIITVAMLAVTCIPAAMLFTQQDVHALAPGSMYFIAAENGKLVMNDKTPVKVKGISMKGSTVTFDNFKFDGGYHAVDLMLLSKGTVVLKGNSVISCTRGSIPSTPAALLGGDSLTIKGNGTLTIIMRDTKDPTGVVPSNVGIFATGDVKICGGAKVYIKTEGETPGAKGIRCRGSYSQADNTLLQADMAPAGEGALSVEAPSLNLPKTGSTMLYKVGKSYTGKAKFVNGTVVQSDGTTPAASLEIRTKTGGSTPEPAKMAAPKTIAAKALNKSTIRVAWSKVSKATQYLVYVSPSKSGTYTLLDTVKSTSLKADGLAKNKTYYFKVRAKGSAGLSGYSKIASAKTGTVKSTCPCGNDHSKAWFTLKQVSKSNIRVKWTPQKGATQYQVANNHTVNKAMKVKWTGNNSQRCYLSMGKSTGKNYQFKMRTVKTKNGKRVYGPWSSAVCITMK